MYYDELPAESMQEAADYFIEHMRDDISLIRVEVVGPDEPGTRGGGQVSRIPRQEGPFGDRT